MSNLGPQVIVVYYLPSSKTQKLGLQFTHTQQEKRRLKHCSALVSMVSRSLTEKLHDVVELINWTTKICSSCMMLSCRYRPKSLRNVSSNFVNQCYKELRQFSTSETCLHTKTQCVQTHWDKLMLQVMWGREGRMSPLAAPVITAEREWKVFNVIKIDQGWIRAL